MSDNIHENNPMQNEEQHNNTPDVNAPENENITPSAPPAFSAESNGTESHSPEHETNSPTDTGTSAQSADSPSSGNPASYSSSYSRFNPDPAQQNRQQYTHSYVPYNTPPTPNPKKKKKNGNSGFSKGTAAVLAICMLLLSGAAGFAGAYAATSLYGENAQIHPGSSADEEKSPSVIYNSAASPVSGMSSDNSSADYYNVASLVKDSVVEITTEFVVSSYFQYITAGAGSGVILSADGYIITNNHVISDTDNGNQPADSITVRLTNGKEYAAQIIGSDADSDIAVIKIEADEALPCMIAGDSDQLSVGEEVVAVGNPLGELGGTVTNGIISALDREVNVDGSLMNLMQTNAAINPGNSGGGLFNMSGELIGIVNAKSSGTGIEGLGFAIPINDALSVAEQLINQGYVGGKPYLGIEFYDVTTYQQALYLRVNSLGIYVYTLYEGYNDDVFEVGDRIIAMDGEEVSSFSDIKSRLKNHEVGDTILFNVYRQGKLIEVAATCYEYNPNVSFDQ